MTADLAARATAAVAALPANLVGSPHYHAVVAIRRTYIADRQPCPRITDMLDAVDEAMRRQAGP